MTGRLKATAQLVALACVGGLLALLVWSVVHQSHAPGVGAKAPAFTLRRLEGAGKVSLASYRGKPVVLNFWASWCEPCQSEAPVLSAAAKTYAAQGVVFIGIAYQTPTKDGQAFIKQHGISYPCGPDPEGDIVTNFGITGIPQTILIDRSGTIVKRFPGQITAATFDPAMQALVKGEPQPTTTSTPIATPTPAHG